MLERQSNQHHLAVCSLHNHSHLQRHCPELNRALQPARKQLESALCRFVCTCFIIPFLFCETHVRIYAHYMIGSICDK